MKIDDEIRSFQPGTDWTKQNRLRQLDEGEKMKPTTLTAFKKLDQYRATCSKM